MNSHAPSLKSGEGFTLVELTIAITLFALMAMILSGAFYLGRRAVEKAQARSEASQTLRSVGDLLAGYIRSAYPYRLSPQNPAVFFSGEANRLDFISALSSGLGGRGLSEVSIAWEGEGGGTGALTLDEKIPVRPEGADMGYKNSVVLSQGVRSFRLDYLDSQSAEERWVEQWDGRERKALPLAVRLSHRSERGEEAQWVFPIMMSVLAP